MKPAFFQKRNMIKYLLNQKEKERLSEQIDSLKLEIDRDTEALEKKGLLLQDRYIIQSAINENINKEEKIRTKI